MAPSCKQTVAEYFAAIRAMDVERWVNIFDANAVSHDPVGTPPLRGHEALRQFLTHIKSAFETIDLTEDNVFINGNSAAVKLTGRGIGRNGKPVIFEGIDIIECNDEGKIVSVHAYWDPAPVMAIIQS
ncbi:MAG: nuclear transport factor 2 family protein [Edaphobacter sp.]